MKNKKLSSPVISAIVPVYNEEQNIRHVVLLRLLITLL